MFKVGRKGGIVDRMYSWEKVLGDAAFTAEENVNVAIDFFVCFCFV